MKVSVVIPAYNEIHTMEPLLAAVRAVPLDKEIIVVDDASCDGTRERLRELAAQSAFTLVEHPVNRGKGAALRSGFERATGDIASRAW